MDFNKENKYVIKETEIIIQKTQTLDNLKFKYDKLILLQGSLYSDCKQISCGSFIDLSKEYSFLTENVEILCISNIHYKNLKKIIYSKSHLNDYLQANNLNKIGLTSGCFDILHEGHIKNLKTCKKNCDFLFVCLSSDAQIKRLKGTKRPINNLMDRIKMLINFDFIDVILLYDEINDDMETELDNIMNIIKPDVWFKGNDYTKEDILKKHPSLKSIMLIDFIEGKSTTNIINKIIY
jgi:rfaE bifunctional protein nucleotidyltransferase chain/domain